MASELNPDGNTYLEPDSKVPVINHSTAKDRFRIRHGRSASAAGTGQSAPFRTSAYCAQIDRVSGKRTFAFARFVHLTTDPPRTLSRQSDGSAQSGACLVGVTLIAITYSVPRSPIIKQLPADRPSRAPHPLRSCVSGNPAER